LPRAFALGPPPPPHVSIATDANGRCVVVVCLWVCVPQDWAFNGNPVLEVDDITAKPDFPRVSNSVTRPMGMLVFNLTSGASRLLDCRQEVQFRIMVFTPSNIPFTDRDD
jgi:hypothetical protein